MSTGVRTRPSSERRSKREQRLPGANPRRMVAAVLTLDRRRRLPICCSARTCARDPKSLQTSGFHVTGTHGQIRLPSVMRSKVACARVFEALATKLGRLPVFARAIDVESGTIDDSKLTVCSVEWSADDLTERITHKQPGDGVQVAKGLQFPKPFEMQNPISDHDACVAGPNRQGQLYLRKFFPIGGGPHKIMVGDVGADLHSMGEELGAELNKQLEVVRRGSSGDLAEVVTTPEEMQQRRSALEKARGRASAKRAKVDVACA